MERVQAVYVMILASSFFWALSAKAQDSGPATGDAPPPEIAAPVTPQAAAAPAESAEVKEVGSGGDPDFKREEKFHHVYESYNARPTSAEEWEKALGQRKAETYKVQKN